jgi:hypothetical protein
MPKTKENALALLRTLDASRLSGLPLHAQNDVLQHLLQATRIGVALRMAESDRDSYPADSIAGHAALQIVREARKRFESALLALDACLGGRKVAFVADPDWESERPLECEIMRAAGQAHSLARSGPVPPPPAGQSLFGQPVFGQS